MRLSSCFTTGWIHLLSRQRQQHQHYLHKGIRHPKLLPYYNVPHETYSHNNNNRNNNVAQYMTSSSSYGKSNMENMDTSFRNSNSNTNTNSEEGEKEEQEELPRIIETNGVPIHLYSYDIEPDALKQLKILAESPIPVDYVSAMPDAHLGKGVTIGTVFASEKYVCPNAVGVDIGCGMAAIPIEGLYKHDLTSRPDYMNRIQQGIKDAIPTGFSQHRSTLHGTKETIEEITDTIRPTHYLKEQLALPRVTDQLGTLGGGNHFLEVVYEEKSEQVWIMLHSGSRNIGNRVAIHYDEVAKDLLLAQRTGRTTGAINAALQNNIHYMPIDSQEGQDYLRDMEWCQQYAYHNRRVMQDLMLKVIYDVTKKTPNMDQSVNIHHNYCCCEDCGNGRKLYVTRKGATSAKEGEMGIIPGSMGTGSYITRGKGNLKSWNSSSHGAGRRMSRTKAHANISQEDFERSMEGILCDTHPNVKDEAPMAYKDLTEVMENQQSLTDPIHHLLPLINVKGFEEKNNRYTKKKRRNRRKKQN